MTFVERKEPNKVINAAITVSDHKRFLGDTAYNQTDFKFDAAASLSDLIN